MLLIPHTHPSPCPTYTKFPIPVPRPPPRPGGHRRPRRQPPPLLQQLRLPRQRARLPVRLQRCGRRRLRRLPGRLLRPGREQERLRDPRRVPRRPARRPHPDRHLPGQRRLRLHRRRQVRGRGHLRRPCPCRLQARAQARLQARPQARGLQARAEAGLQAGARSHCVQARPRACRVQARPEAGPQAPEGVRARQVQPLRLSASDEKRTPPPGSRSVFIYLYAFEGNNKFQHVLELKQLLARKKLGIILAKGPPQKLLVRHFPDGEMDRLFGPC